MSPVRVVAAFMAALLAAPGPGFSIEARKPSEMIHGVPRLETGDWLLESYIDALKERHYWEEAGEGLKAVYARISEDLDSRLQLCFGDWREPVGCLWIRHDGTAESAVGVDGGYELSVTDHRRFILSYGEDRDMRFRWVGERETWVAHKILGGEYKDARGQKHSLNSKGDAVLAGRQAIYSMPVGNASDYAPHTLILDGVLCRFEFDGKQLRVWEIPQDLSLPAPPEPLLDLRLIFPADALVLPPQKQPRKP